MTPVAVKSTTVSILLLALVRELTLHLYETERELTGIMLTVCFSMK